MAKVWIVMVVLFAANVLASEDTNCDECIRSGKSWCYQHTKDTQTHCFAVTRDEACPGNQRDPLEQFNLHTDEYGDLINPKYTETKIYLNQVEPRKTVLTYTSTVKKNITINVLATHHEDKISVTEGNTECSKTECKIDIMAKISPDFCSFHKFVDVGIKIDEISEEAKIRYMVPCSCQCTQTTETKSDKCNYHGNYTCGICTCEEEWTGENCNKVCHRGDQDLTCTSDKKGQLMECQGNGKCVCGQCKCFKYGEGSQYFDSSDQCSDICTQTIKYHKCFGNGTLDGCEDITVEKEADVNEVYQNRKVWVHCKEREGDCDFDYYAMKGDGYHVLLNNNSCNNMVAGAVFTDGSGASTSKVPLILGILAGVGLIAGVGGFLLWKHMNAIPALPMSNPGYAHMGAEDCTGENPLYIPPTSSFKNPTYGKC